MENVFLMANKILGFRIMENCRFCYRESLQSLLPTPEFLKVCWVAVMAYNLYKCEKYTVFALLCPYVWPYVNVEANKGIM